MQVGFVPTITAKKEREMPAPKVIITTSAALSSAAEMIADHIDEAPDSGTMDALQSLVDGLNACAVDHGGSTDAAIRVTLATVLPVSA